MNKKVNKCRWINREKNKFSKRINNFIATSERSIVLSKYSLTSLEVLRILKCPFMLTSFEVAIKKSITQSQWATQESISNSFCVLWFCFIEIF